jgi:hypothetical protein
MRGEHGLLTSPLGEATWFDLNEGKKRGLLTSQMRGIDLVCSPHHEGKKSGLLTSQ